MDTNKIKVLISKYTPEKLDPNLVFFNIGLTVGRMQQYLDDRPEQKEKILKFLKEEGS